MNFTSNVGIFLDLIQKKGQGEKCFRGVSKGERKLSRCGRWGEYPGEFVFINIIMSQD
jgi:hypothetical protein